MLPANHKICLVGLSVDYTKQDILDYMQSLFPSAQFELNMKLKKNNKNKGWAALTTDRQIFKKSILEMKKFNLKGKNFFATDFLEKEDLQKFQEDFNRRKLFVNKIPLEVTTMQFRDFFEQFGELEDAFVVTSKRKKLDLNYGFLIFKRREDSERLLEHEVIDFSGSEVTIERFRCRQTQQDDGLAKKGETGTPKNRTVRPEDNDNKARNSANLLGKKKKKKRKRQRRGSKLDIPRGNGDSLKLGRGNGPEFGGLEGQLRGQDCLQSYNDDSRDFSIQYSPYEQSFQQHDYQPEPNLCPPKIIYERGTINAHASYGYNIPRTKTISSFKPTVFTSRIELEDLQNKKKLAFANRKKNIGNSKKKFVPFLDFESKDPRSSAGKVVRLARREIQSNQKLSNLRLNKYNRSGESKLASRQGVQEYYFYKI